MFVIGTAGHVDHGKSSLVNLLSGIDPDRWQEEKDRGMTIDLGFAWFTLPSGNEVSVIDVPGHEKFVNHMLAGIGGIDLALMIIAADESIMPQTLEHFNIFKVANINSTLKYLREKNFWVYGFDSNANKNFDEIIWKGNNVLLFGSEGFGMKKHTIKYTDFILKININKKIESLNISNSAAIVFHHINKYKKIS